MGNESIMGWLATLYRIGPVILSLFEGTAAYAPYIVAAVGAAEQLADATSGPEKKKYALALVDSSIETYNSLAPDHHLDAAVAHSIASIAIDVLVATINVWSASPIWR